MSCWARTGSYSLVGMGGVGKTRLGLGVARAAAADFSDGAWLGLPASLPPLAPTSWAWSPTILEIVLMAATSLAPELVADEHAFRWRAHLPQLRDPDFASLRRATRAALLVPTVFGMC